MKNYLYGIGKNLEGFISDEIINLDNVEGFVETQKMVSEYYGKPVYNADEISAFDRIIITVTQNDEIYDHCIKLGIDSEKIGCLIPSAKINKIENDKIIQAVLTDKGVSYINKRFYGNDDLDWVKRDQKQYIAMNTRKEMEIQACYNHYIYDDKFDHAGRIDSYFWQDLWAAKKIIAARPGRHYDVGSRIDGFIAYLLAAGIKTDLIDVRPLEKEIPGLGFVCADATSMDQIADDSLESFSALCSLEHFGLGRYGDSVDPEACYKAFKAIQRKVRSGGNIYISVPVGKDHVEFNAHRVFSALTIINEFNECNLIEYSCAQKADIEINVDIHKYDNKLDKGADIYGLFHFKKK